MGWDFILTAVSHILFVEKWKSLEEEGAENMQKKVGLNDMRVYFDMEEPLQNGVMFLLRKPEGLDTMQIWNQKWNCLILCVMP